MEAQWAVLDCATVLYSAARSGVVGVRLGKVALAAVRPPISRGRARGGGMMGTGTNAKGKEAHGPAVPARADSTSAWHMEPACRERNETHEGFMLNKRGEREWEERTEGDWGRKREREVVWNSVCVFTVCVCLSVHMWPTEWPARQGTGRLQLRCSFRASHRC